MLDSKAKPKTEEQRNEKKENQYLIRLPGQKVHLLEKLFFMKLERSDRHLEFVRRLSRCPAEQSRFFRFTQTESAAALVECALHTQLFFSTSSHRSFAGSLWTAENEVFGNRKELDTDS